MKPHHIHDYEANMSGQQLILSFKNEIYLSMGC